MGEVDELADADSILMNITQREATSGHNSSAPRLATSLPSSTAHQHQIGLLKTLRRRLGCYRLHLVEGYGVGVIATETETGLDPALAGIDQRDGKPLAVAGDHRDVPGGLRKRHAAGFSG